MSNQQNNQLNEARESLNKRTVHKTFLGRTKRAQWNNKRRFRGV